MRSTTRCAAVAVITAGGFLLASPATPATATPSSRGPLIMTSFVQSGRIDVRRNEMLLFKFTSLVRRGSVDDRTVRVSQVIATGDRNAIGARIVRANKVTFDPTRTQRNYDASRQPNTTVLEKDHPSGFEAYQDHEVELPAIPSLRTVQAPNGDPLLRPFLGTFRTNDTYDDPVPGQPSFIGDHGTGLLAFDPPRSGPTGLVDEDAVIILEFSEPMLIDSIDPGSTLHVTRIAVGEEVPGYVKPDPEEPNGRRFLFVPATGFGTDEVNQRGWDIQVSVTSGITDLAGNGLKRPVIFPTFRTRYVPNKPTCSVVSESFNDQKMMDPATVNLGGEWDTTEQGYLHGGVPTTYPPVDVRYTQANTGLSSLVRLAGGFDTPLSAVTPPPGGAGGGCGSHPTGSRIQLLYVPGDVGAAAAITGVAWAPSSNATFDAQYPEVVLKLAHTSVQNLSQNFEPPGNVNIGTPQTVFDGPYSVPQHKNINGQPTGTDPVDANGVTTNANATGYWDWPALTSPFEWNGTNNLVFDAAVQGGTNCQIVRAAYVPGGQLPNRRAVSWNWQSQIAEFTVDPVVYDIRFRKRRRTTQAISLWYQLASDFPVFAQPIVSPSGQPGGVDVVLEVEGAAGKPDPFNPGGFIADPTTGTGFTTTVSDIDKHRFFRFRVSMIANLVTNQTARIGALQFPYCF